MAVRISDGDSLKQFNSRTLADMCRRLQHSTSLAEREHIALRLITELPGHTATSGEVVLRDYELFEDQTQTPSMDISLTAFQFLFPNFADKSLSINA